MTRPIETVTETDLQAFVDDQLDMTRQVEVEDYLSRHPAAAARVMADLQVRDALRLAFVAAPERSTPRTTEAARRLQRGLAWGRIASRVRRLAAVAALVAFGWLAHAEVGLLEIRETRASLAPPPFVADALHAHRTALVRAGMHSQPAGTDYDPKEILATTRIAMPLLPGDWRVRDAQVFPWTGGSSVELTVDAGALGTLSLFAARSASFGVIEPTTVRAEAQTTAYWQIGSQVYALTGRAAGPSLERAAAQLARTLH